MKFCVCSSEIQMRHNDSHQRTSSSTSTFRFLQPESTACRTHEHLVWGSCWREMFLDAANNISRTNAHKSRTWHRGNKIEEETEDEAETVAKEDWTTDSFRQRVVIVIVIVKAKSWARFGQVLEINLSTWNRVTSGQHFIQIAVDDDWTNDNLMINILGRSI